MKKILLTLCVTASLAFSGLASAADKIGVVNMQEVLETSGYSKRLQAQYRSKIESLQKDIEVLQQSFVQLKAKAQQNDALTLSAAQRENLQKELRNKALEIKFKETSIQEEAKYEEKKTIDAITKKAIVELNKIAKAGGYDLIVQREAALYASEAVDLTGELLTVLK